MNALLVVRVRAARRFVVEVVRREPLSAGLVAAGALAAAYHVARLAGTTRGAPAVALAALLIVFLVHGTRRDARFLRLCGRAPRPAFALEYALLVLPLAALLIRGVRPALGFALPVASSLVATFPSGWSSTSATRRAAGRARVRLAPVRDFEWLSGARRAWPAILSIYVLALLLSAVPALVIAASTLLTWTACGFYGDAEGRPMLLAFGARASRFLRIKTGRALVQWAIWVAPLGALFLARHPALWPFLLAALVANAAVLLGSVLAKYAAYHEGRAGGAAAAIVPALLTLSLLMPPVTLFALARLWRAATRTLEPQLGTLD